MLTFIALDHFARILWAFVQAWRRLLLSISGKFAFAAAEFHFLF